jgi:hypothetical protein
MSLAPYREPPPVAVVARRAAGPGRALQDLSDADGPRLLIAGLSWKPALAGVLLVQCAVVYALTSLGPMWLSLLLTLCAAAAARFTLLPVHRRDLGPEELEIRDGWLWYGEAGRHREATRLDAIQAVALDPGGAVRVERRGGSPLLVGALLGQRSLEALQGWLSEHVDAAARARAVLAERGAADPLAPEPARATSPSS